MIPTPRTHRLARIAGRSAPLLLAGAVALVASTGAAALAAPETAEPHCVVTGGALTWGVKESFRSYISGTIANGEWQTDGGATYTTPEFTWPTKDAHPSDAETKDVHFSGTVTFTGHNGLLRTTLSQPTLAWHDDTARVLFDISGVSMDDALAGNTEAITTAEQVPFVALEITPTQWAGTGDLTLENIPATITAEGYEAFGSYEAGTPMDPVTIQLNRECSTPAVGPAPAASDASPEPSTGANEPDAADHSEAPHNAVWWTVGAGLVAGASGIIVWRARRAPRKPAESDTE